MRNLWLTSICLMAIALCSSCTNTSVNKKPQNTPIRTAYSPLRYFEDYPSSDSAKTSTEFTFTETPASFSGPSNRYTYTLPCSSLVTLDVLNAAQQKIDSTDFGYRYPGAYQVIWHATDFKTGIYYFQLHACDSTITLKTLLLR